METKRTAAGEPGPGPAFPACGYLSGTGIVANIVLVAILACQS